jgi:predicted nucleotide-binding protein
MEELKFYVKKLQDLEYRGEWKEQFRNNYERIYDFIDQSTFLKRGVYLKELDRLKSILLDMPYIASDEDKLHFRRIQKNIIEQVYKVMEENKKIFLVHGSESNMIDKVSTFLGRLKLDYDLLEKSEELISIKKFVKKADKCDYAIVLLTAKEMVFSEITSGKSRVSQNILLELGYFLSSVGKKNLLILYPDDLEIELPYKLDGLQLHTFNPEGNWRSTIIEGLTNAGIYLDTNIVESLTTI